MHEWAKEVYTYAAGIAYKPVPMYTLTGRFAYSENTMAAYQVDATTRAALPAERRYRYEGGILANFHTAFNPWVTLFYYDTKNQKVSAGSYIDPTTDEEVNLVTNADVRTKGVEVGVSGLIVKQLSYHLLYSYVQTDDHDTNLQIAHHTASGRLSYKYKGFDANLNVRYVGPHDQSVSPAGTLWYEMGDYTKVDANIGYNFKVFGRATKIMFYGQNLGDVHYTTRYVSAAYKDPGRQVGVQLNYSFF
jgi:outer membrane receptor protein involved in Fe transport